MPSEWYRTFLNFFLFWKRVLAEKGIAIGIERSLVETQLVQRHLVKIRDLILFQGSRWNLVQNCRRSWFEWVRLSEAVPSLMTQSWPWGSQLKKNCFFVIVIKNNALHWYLLSWTLLFILAFASLKKLQP